MRESELEITTKLIRDALEADAPKQFKSRQAIELQVQKLEAAKEAYTRLAEYCLMHARGLDAQIDLMEMFEMKVG